MKYTTRVICRREVAGVMLVTLGFLGTTLCGCSKSPDGGAVATADADADATPETVAEEPPIEVPDGTPEELFEFMEQTEIKELGAPEDEGDAAAPTPDQEALGRAIRRVMRVRLDACDKILAKQIPDETRTRAIRLRLEALRTLSAVDPDQYSSQYDSYVKELLSGSDPFLARLAKATQFQNEVMEVVSEGGENVDALLTQLKAVLDDPDAGPEVMDMTRDAVSWLFERGQVEVATEGYRLIGKRFENNADQNVSDEARMLLSQATYNNLKRLTQAVSEDKEGSVPALLDALNAVLAEADNDPNSPAYAMQTAQFLEFSGNFAEAKQAYERIRERYAQATDNELARDIGTSVDLALKRLNLIGTDLTLQGVQLNGQPFDWSTYRGKPTLVCFWTTWHQGWPQFADEIRAAIAQHAGGDVQVVAISLDDSRSTLETYIRENPTAWTILVNPDPQAAGFENPNAIKCGIEMIPFVMLVDADGKVIDIHLAQQRLVDALSKLKK
ncbi:MAG: TlpA family protein disulfide reductase [Planctomycetales bacterium]|nr:TlpA family protein disulfide reductase [Planctomycetales bacterium]